MILNRRSLLRQAAAAPFFVRRMMSAPPSGTLRLAAFGGGNMGFETLNGIATHPKVALACVADVDPSLLDRLKQKYPAAKIYPDWRQMLAREHRHIDIACVGVPDHMHAPIAVSAMNRGLPVYVQKPLAHDLYEVRTMTTLARHQNLVTQMGIQIHSRAEYRAAVQIVQSGAIGKVSAVHSWSNKKWGDTAVMPDRSDPVPPTLHWDLWLGVTAPRPYIDGYYHPVNWRKRIDFGTATFGDMGCHILDPVFGALSLTAPLWVRSDGAAPGQHSWGLDNTVHFLFPGTPYTEGDRVAVTWYDGDRRPGQDVQAYLGGHALPDQGSIFIGSKGVMLLPHVAAPVLFPEAQFRDFPMPQTESENHYHQFVDAVLSGGKASADFHYSGPLTEAVLMGPLATRFPGTTLEWDTDQLRFKNSSEANRLIRRKYRFHWRVSGLS
ncbi:MAG TPA: Gfo/Idh/MocA family oxidoreductase [Bryobacteraceae bacterium]|nr:Gfo/Idh/MocA family oxidoreductase [Bryobacteraceae bacterium]